MAYPARNLSNTKTANTWKSMFTQPPAATNGGKIAPTNNYNNGDYATALKNRLSNTNAPYKMNYASMLKSRLSSVPASNPGNTARTNYAAALKARLANSPTGSNTQASTQQVSSTTPTTQQRATTTTPAATVTSSAARTGTGNTNYASMLKARLEGNTGDTSGLASMLAKARGLSGGGANIYSSGSDDTQYSSGQSSSSSSSPFNYMSDEEAQSKASAQLDPTYNSLRDRLDANYARDRDNIKAQMAARFGGLSGINGGHLNAATTANTQEHALAISDIENKRVAAVNEMAQALQDRDYQRAYQLYALNKQLEYQQQQLELQQDTLDFQKDSWQQEFDSDNSWKQKYFDRDVLESDRDYDWGVYKDDRDSARDVLVSDRDYDWETNPDTWKNQLYVAQANADIANTWRSANAPYSSSSGGLKSSSSPVSSTSNPFGSDTDNMSNEELFNSLLKDSGTEKSYTTADLDSYISSLRNSLGTPEAVLNYLQSQVASNPISYLQGNGGLNMNFYNDALLRLQDHISG